MTRDEALLAMRDGEKVAHRFFTDDEYIYMEDHTIFTEEGYNMGNIFGEFWKMRGDEPGGEMWLEDWSIYKN